MISIVFGTFNRVDKLTNSINSIKKAASKLDQMPEIIIIDGGSTDGTLEYLSKQKDIIVINEGGLHGVTRAYNRGFRLASRKYITWFSDDFIYDENALKISLERLEKEDENTLISFSIDVGDGNGFINYAPNTPVGICSKKLFQKVDYWSEDFITYASDNDFNQKILMAGGKVLPEHKAKIIHDIDIKDFLHKENLSGNKCSKRYFELYKNGINKWNKTYPEIWISASSSEELYDKIIDARNNIGWVNFYTDNLFGMDNLFNSMNVVIGNK